MAKSSTMSDMFWLAAVGVGAYIVWTNWSTWFPPAVRAPAGNGLPQFPAAPGSTVVNPPDGDIVPPPVVVNPPIVQRIMDTLRQIPRGPVYTVQTGVVQQPLVSTGQPGSGRPIVSPYETLTNPGAVS